MVFKTIDIARVANLRRAKLPLCARCPKPPFPQRPPRQQPPNKKRVGQDTCVSPTHP